MNFEVEYGKKGRPRLVVMNVHGTYHFSFNTQSELDVWYHTIRSCLSSLSQRRHDAVWKRMSLVAKVHTPAHLRDTFVRRRLVIRRSLTNERSIDLAGQQGHATKGLHVLAECHALEARQAVAELLE